MSITRRASEIGIELCQIDEGLERITQSAAIGPQDCEALMQLRIRLNAATQEMRQLVEDLETTGIDLLPRPGVN